MSEPIKLRILFVDDEPEVLGALQNLLRRMRKSWDMSFVTSGAEALAALEASPFDVVVSDMGMPRMDGAALLAQVRDRHPGAARIILSGYADPDAMVRALPVAHQFLSKPCDTEVLKSGIERACSVRRLLEDPALREVVGRLEHLPGSPAIYRKLTEAIEDPDTNVRDIVRFVEHDPAMCARLLQIVNSSYSGFESDLVSIQDAVVHLGLQQLRGVALAAHIFASNGVTAGDRRLLDRMQRDSVITARIARRLLPEPKLAELAFSAALVRDVGQTILATAFPTKYETVFREAMKHERAFIELEREQVGTTHSQIGGYLLAMWGLPVAIVDAVSFHQEPKFLDDGNARLIAAVHVASALVDAWLEGLPREEARIDRGFLEQAGVLADLPAWHKIAVEELAKQRPADAA